MSTILGHAWLIVGVLALLKVGVLTVLYRSRRTIRLLREKVREEREGGDRLLAALHDLRAKHGKLVGRESALLRQRENMLCGVVELPLSEDIRSAYEENRIYLPRIGHEEPGIAEVVIPGIAQRTYILHINPKAQTHEERGHIYAALRNSKDARALLRIDIVEKSHERELDERTPAP